MPLSQNADQILIWASTHMNQDIVNAIAQYCMPAEYAAAKKRIKPNYQICGALPMSISALCVEAGFNAKEGLAAIGELKAAGSLIQVGKGRGHAILVLTTPLIIEPTVKSLQGEVAALQAQVSDLQIQLQTRAWI